MRWVSRMQTGSAVAAGASDGDQSKASREEVGVGLRSQVCLGQWADCHTRLAGVCNVRMEDEAKGSWQVRGQSFTLGCEEPWSMLNQEEPGSSVYDRAVTRETADVFSLTV